MSEEGFSREPRAAYCEDESDEEEVATPLAHIAVERANDPCVTKRASYERRRNDGSSSGYSTASGISTSTGTSSGREDMANIGMSTMERQPQPYAYAQRMETHGRSLRRGSEEVIAPPARKMRYYVHQKGECYVCDTYGEHLPEDARGRKETAVPPSPKTSKKAPGQPTRPEDAAPRPIRRDSSVRASRPVSMYATVVPQFNYHPTQTPSMLQYAAPQMSPGGWTTPVTPSTPYTSPFSYAPTVVTANYLADGSYFEKPLFRQNRPSRSERRVSVYGEAIVRQSKPERRPSESERTNSTREHVRSNSDRNVRAEDCDRMPPPPRPTMTLAHRPSIRKSATYNTPLTSSTNRRSQMIEDDAVYVSNAMAPSPAREKQVETSLPPSSYRGPADMSDSRPPNRKSASYSTPTSTTKVSSSMLPPIATVLPRQSTTKATPTETRRLVDAEVYQAQRRSLTTNDLTAEALLSLKQRNPSSKSETSSHRSHHTKSSSSAGGKSKRSNGDIKMTINGVNVSIPPSLTEHKISISAGEDGDVSISLGSHASRDENESRTGGPQRRIERAPSMTSRASYSSSKSMSSKERERARERERERDLEQYEKARRQSQASRSRSRAEVVRKSYDHDRDRDSPNPWTS